VTRGGSVERLDGINRAEVPVFLKLQLVVTVTLVCIHVCISMAVEICVSTAVATTLCLFTRIDWRVHSYLRGRPTTQTCDDPSNSIGVTHYYRRAGIYSALPVLW